ncbi:anti-sigma factor [Rhodococcus sp. NBC_00297]|uniref:anti-sigma factor n=1 Tax=Rhodococcus sp. NBC_00297 TaxID=2976005 RepID=UPI002E27D714|nr:anti-sigma factor [Rhodococcus sp. NBC_00297]
MSDGEGRHRRPDDASAPDDVSEQDAMQDVNEMNDSVVDDAYAYALDAIDPAERADIERRLAQSDAATRSWFESIVESVDETMALSASSTAAEPPSSLRASILAAVESTPQGDARPLADPIDDAPVAPVVSLDDRRRTRLRVLAAAAAAVVIVGVGGAVVTQQLGDAPSSPTSQVLAAGDIRTSTVEVEGGGTATVRWSRSQDAAVVTLDGLAEPGDGKVFEMWLIGEDPAPRPAGLVPADAATPAREHVVTGLSDATTWAVTVEPESGSDAPTTTPIAAVTLDA